MLAEWTISVVIQISKENVTQTAIARAMKLPLHGTKVVERL